MVPCSGCRPSPVDGARSHADQMSSDAWSPTVSGLGVEAAPRPPDTRSAHQPVQGAADRVDAPAVLVAAQSRRDIPGPHIGVTGCREILQNLFGEFAVLLVIVTAGMRPRASADRVGRRGGGGVGFGLAVWGGGGGGAPRRSRRRTAGCCF